MDRRTYNTMMEGLLATAIEKNNVLGKDATADIKAILNMVDDLQAFWNGDETLTAFDWAYEVEKLLKEAQA